MEKNEIIVIYGSAPSEMAEKIAEAAALAELIGDRKKRIGLKPNLVVAKPANDGATTHVEIAVGLISYLKKNGFNNITILEGSWVGDSTYRAFSACGYSGLAEKTGAKLVDTQKDAFDLVDCHGIKIEISRTARTIDFMINLPVLKGHCQTLLTCALKNNKGIISNSEKRRFHAIGLHKPIAHLNTAARNDFIVVDGICGDLDFEEGGNPLPQGRIFAARDPVLCDAWAAGLLGYHPDQIPYIGLAEKLGVGQTGPAKIRQLNSASANEFPATSAKPSLKVGRLSPFISDDNACSACYAGLIFALSRLGIETHKLSKAGKISIGQGFQGKKGSLGIGHCTAGFAHSCPGCPPTGAEVLQFLKKAL